MGCEPAEADSTRAKRVYLQYPADWDELTDEERHAVALEMAKELQLRLGIEPTDD